MQVSLKLFGTPSIRIGDKEQLVSMNRSGLLCAYLAVHGTWIRRDQLLALFWPEMREPKARQNLRSLLYKTKKEAFAETLEYNDSQVRFEAQTDVKAFQEAISKADWLNATKLYKGEFLRTYKGRESVVFEEWLLQAQDDYFSSWRNAVIYATQKLIEQNNAAEAVSLLKKILTRNPLDEDAVQLCMKAQLQAKQPSSAKQTFQSFKKQLLEDLDLEPLPKTIELAQSLQVEKDKPVKQQKIQPIKQQLGNQATLPEALTPFVGRTLELLELSNLLAEPQHRLITLLGPGGMGKSRLSLRLLEEQQEAFADGVTFVSLAPLTSAADIPMAIATAVHLSIESDSSVREQVINFLYSKDILLVLDNYEHLIDGASFVETLLTSCLKLKIICTSRVILGLPGELIYDLVGLSLPSKSTDQLEAFDAVQLFLRNARRVKPDFRLENKDKSVIVELVYYLQGMPLAIELAANWVRLFPVSELLQALKQDINLLEVTGQQVSEKHQSMRKVFAYSWKLLSEEQKRVLAELSIFRGGFNRDAALSVAKASVRVLISLVNKSLIRTTPSGRFSILEVIRQYAAEYIKNQDLVSKAHSSYYLKALAESIEGIRGDDPNASFRQLDLDFENIRIAWQYAVKIEAFELLVDGIEALQRFADASGRFEEGIFMIKQMINALDESNEEDKRFLAHALTRLSSLKGMGIKPEEAEALNLRAYYLLQQLDEPILMISAIQGLGKQANRQGDYESTIRFEKQALDIAYKINNKRLIAKNLGRLAVFEDNAGYQNEAKQHYQEAITRFKEQNNLIGLTYNLGNLGALLIDIGELEQANHILSEATRNARAMGDKTYLSDALSHWAACKQKLGFLEEAELLLTEALSVATAINDISSLAGINSELGLLHLKMNRLVQASAFFKASLNNAVIFKNIPDMLQALTYSAQLLILIDREFALEVLSLGVLHAGTAHYVRLEAQALLDECEEGLRNVNADDLFLNSSISKALLLL